jgi:hypothetical protein
MLAVQRIKLDKEERCERKKAEDLARWEQYQFTGKAIPQAIATDWLTHLGQSKVIPCPK